MRIERSKNAGRNLIFGILLKIYQVFIPFILRTAMIYFMGVEYLGLNSLFSSILQVLNLTELGVGSAMVFSMYRPIAEDDTETICALMRLYKNYYRIIGLVIAVIGVVLTPFIPFLIEGDLPEGLNIYVLYLLNLGATVLSYWLFAYKNALFQAHQRVDVISKINLITNSVQYLIQLLVIIFTQNYYLYIIVMLVTQAATNIITGIAASSKYPDYQAKGKLPRASVKEINQRIRDLFTSKIGGVVVSSADTVVISAFLGLSVLAVYQNYYFILTSIIGFVAVVFQACTAGIGNSIILESAEKNYSDLKTFTFLISWIAGFCTCFFLCLYQPFMEIWVGKDLMLNFTAVICFCVYYFIYEINQLLNTYKDAAGIWHEDRFRPLITAVANLTLNLILVQFWGIYGVLLSTVLSMLFVGMPWLLHNLFTVLFERSRMSGYVKMLFKYTFIVAISCVFCYALSSVVNFTAFGNLVYRAVVCCVIPNLLYFVVYHKTVEFAQCVQLVDKMTKTRFRLSRFI